MKEFQIGMKRFSDILFSIAGLILFGWLLCIVILIAGLDTKSSGFFIQERVGQNGIPFLIYKVRTIHQNKNKISKIGAFLRKSKFDELPQLINVLNGTMSVVGPRPDIPGYYDKLVGDEKLILSLKPGLTSEASLKYWNEEELLSQEEEPLKFNDKVLFPDKVKMNLDYYYNHSFLGDLKIIWKTIWLFIN